MPCRLPACVCGVCMSSSALIEIRYHRWQIIFSFFFSLSFWLKFIKFIKISSNYTIFLFVHVLLLFRWPDRQSGSAPIFFFVSFEWPKFNTEEKNSKIVKYSRLFSIYSLSQKFMNLANKNCVINLLLLNKSLMV